MGKFGRRPITDASKGQPKLVYHFNESERIDRRPQGKCERFVDPAGNVMTVQLAGDGDPNPAEGIRRRRAELHKKGFVEHAKCPLRHGHNLIPGKTTKDFLRIPDQLKAPCDGDPARMLVKDKFGDIQAQKACPHIEWLIARRIEVEKEELAKRNEHRVAQEKREQQKRELEQWQFEKAKAEMEAAKNRSADAARGKSHQPRTPE